MPDFIHLHCHTQYSLLDGASRIETMMDKAVSDGQAGVALTDHGNMYGVFKFVNEAHKRNLKPIAGCEFYLVEDRHRKSFSRKKGERDRRYHQLLLAKNEQGYRNLSKLCSLGFIEGAYGEYPRIDKELIEKYHEGLIATSCCLAAEIPSAILQGDLEGAESKLKWWLNLFGEDYYIELQRHKGLENIDGRGKSQEEVNQVLLGLAEKYHVKIIATNDAHYVEEEDWKPHDILLCINTGSKLNDEDRFKFSSSDYYFKTKAEMAKLFQDLPQALDNTFEIFDKIEPLSLQRDVLLPAFPVPETFASQDDYLRHLTFEGAKERYGTLDSSLEERINFELEVIRQSGYPGYFLIVQDLTSTARKMGVSVGPGRGSAAGSAVAYCLGITNVDPIKYDLLFERFLNPERISMPDIDIDFDDEGRSKVIDYVVDKYGQNQVAQIITYGSMAAKLSIRDVGRVLDLELSEVDKITKSFPSFLGASLQKVLAKGGLDPQLREMMNSEDVEKAQKIIKLSKKDDLTGLTLRTARELEGNIRNTGIHACGVIITPGDISDYIPVATAKDTDLWVTQFDNSVVEQAGLLKMDFLGLKTLSIIKDAINLIKDRHQIEIDPDNIPLDDEKTFELFQRGDTIGIFQYESPGMQKHLKNLKPNKFEDLIAMNALYRPGPLQYIPNFIARKNGKEAISYDLPEMEDILAETYGITVYQEQVMLLSQKLAGFSKGQADALRKGMGKKKKKIIDELYPLFVEGCEKNGHPRTEVDKIWNDWQAFASYAFNKSHSTCYALVAFQTAYLKAHYPAEFMASVLTHNKSDITKVNFFLRECKKLHLDVLIPDVNESGINFGVNTAGQIRIGLSAIKNVGGSAVEEIIRERDANGPYKSLFDMMTRVNLRVVNKKCVENLVLAGALDCFEILKRSQYFAASDKYETFIEHALRYGSAVQQHDAEKATSLFGDSDEVLIPEPDVPEVPAWPMMHRLNQEKEVIGIYASGHPLDSYKLELENFVNCELVHFDRVKAVDRRLKVAGIITKANHGTNKRGNGYCRFTLQDYNGSVELYLGNDEYQKFKGLIEEGQVVYIDGHFKNRFNSDELYFQPLLVKLLTTISDELTRSITLKVPVSMISPEFVQSLESACREHEGKHHLRMVVFDMEHEVKVRFMSGQRQVHIDSHFVEELDKLGVPYKLN
ncbi:MAG: DNA polymerase III subunit alpha [Saprospiraceae bacterium]|nr:DNA polymerase III subunit alpha [Saprospiraceae bacterium]